MAMVLRSCLLLAIAAPMFACEVDGSYVVWLAGTDTGTAVVTSGNALSIDLGALGSTSGTFDRGGGVTSGTGTALLSGGTRTMAAADGTHQGPFSWDSDCTTITLTLELYGSPTEVDLVKVPPPSPPTGDQPCFPSSSSVTLASGEPTRIDELNEGDRLVAATASGALTVDTVSFLSIAKPGAEASFITVTTEAGTLTLTPEHHLPVGAACCSELKKAKDVIIGDVLWAHEGDAIAPRAVVALGMAIKSGLHSPVLTGGSFPVVDGLVTSFDAFEGVTLARIGLQHLTTLCKATGTCPLLRSAFIGTEHKYIGQPLSAALQMLVSPLVAGELAK